MSAWTPCEVERAHGALKMPHRGVLVPACRANDAVRNRAQSDCVRRLHPRDPGRGLARLVVAAEFEQDEHLVKHRIGQVGRINRGHFVGRKRGLDVAGPLVQLAESNLRCGVGEVSLLRGLEVESGALVVAGTLVRHAEPVVRPEVVFFQAQRLLELANGGRALEHPRVEADAVGRFFAPAAATVLLADPNRLAERETNVLVLRVNFERGRIRTPCLFGSDERRVEIAARAHPVEVLHQQARL